MEAVIFDMDGLMFDSEVVWAASWPPAFAKYGLSLKPDLLLSCVGVSRERSARLVGKAYGQNSQAVLAFEEHYEIAQRMFIQRGAPKKPGLDEVLDYLGDRDVPLAVASSSPSTIVTSLLEFGCVADRFDVVISGDSGCPSKPHPDIFLAAAQELCASPSNTVVLEDSPNGIRAAHAGGFIPIMVPDVLQPDDAIRACCHMVCEDLYEAQEAMSDL